MYCKNCKHMDNTKIKHRPKMGVCTNTDKIDEDYSHNDVSDMLIYSYTEGGLFFVGDNFGCIHFKDKKDLS